MKKYVVLEHLRLPDRGLRFFTMNSGNSKDNTHGYTGEKWYEEVGFADTTEEAQQICSEYDLSKLPSFDELLEFHKTNSIEKPTEKGYYETSRGRLYFEPDIEDINGDPGCFLDEDELPIYSIDKIKWWK